MNSETRVRFAPSPTGTLHIGGARTFLFNWLFARKCGGKMVLRLEDTDIDRSSEVSAKGIVEGLKWLGLDWDEGPDKGGPYGPYRQSERLHIYQQYITRLLDEGKAYYCFCSADELAMEREAAQKAKIDYKYSGKCRFLTPEQVQENLNKGLKHTIRFKVPQNGVSIVHDLVRGDVEFSNNIFDDFIIVKSNGWPTYNFAVVIDDAAMAITHVIRAEEHLSNTPKQLFLYEALGLPQPLFAHVSMILAPDRSKLSKRHGATSVQEFRDQGYLPETLVNYLALLGWSTGEDVDIMSVEEMLARFDLNNMVRSPAIYDIRKLTWMNGHYITNYDLVKIVSLVLDKTPPSWRRNINREYLTRAVDLLRNRSKTINEIVENIAYFFVHPDSYDQKGVRKYFSHEQSQNYLKIILNLIKELGNYDSGSIESAFRECADKLGIKAAELIHPTRLALTGLTATPGLFEIMELLGKDECIKRLTAAINYVQQM